MKTLLEKIEGINFKKTFIVFFAALFGFGILYAVTMTVSGYGDEVSRLWERLTFARLRGRMFTDLQGTFRFFASLFLIGFHAILALWVYADGKKYSKRRALWSVLTLFIGVPGCLLYMIRRLDRADKTNMQTH